MTSKIASLAKRKKELSHGRLLCIERLEQRQFMDASTEFALSVQSGEDSSRLSTLQAPTNKLVEYRIQLTDMFGKPIDSVRVDDEIKIKVYVRDLRDLPPNSLHLFSAYADLSLDPKLFVPTGEGKLGDDFWEYKGQLELRGTQNSLPNRTSSQIGGVVTARYPKGSGHLLFEIPVRTVAEGEGTIATSPVESKDSSLYPTSFYGSDYPILEDSIVFDALSVSVLPKLGQVPNGVQVPTSPPALEALESNRPQPIDSQPATAQPATALPVTAQPVIEAAVAIRPTPKVAVSPRQLATKNEVPADQQDLQDSFASDSRLDKAQQTHSVDVLKADILRTLLELAVSRNSIFSAVQHLSLSQSLSLFSYVPLQKRLTGPSQLFSQLSAYSIAHRFGERHDQSQTWVARDFIDRMLEQLETGSSLQTKSFEWEATFGRMAMRRLPFRFSQNQYQFQEFADVDMAHTFADILESREKFNVQVAIDGLLSSGRTEDLEGEYRRSSLKVLPLMDAKIAIDPDKLISELKSSVTQTSEALDDENRDHSSSSDRVEQSRTGWPNHFLIAAASFYIVLRMRFRSLLNRYDARAPLNCPVQ